MTKKDAEEKLKCPCCLQMRGPSQMQRMFHIKLHEGGTIRSIDLEKLKNYNYTWACDICIQEHKVILGKPNLQTYCDYEPYLAYFDKTPRCETCGISFIFSKKEQQYFYETKKYWVQRIPQHCLACRKVARQEKRTNTELSILLSQKESLSLPQWERIAEIYSEMGNESKLKFAYSQIKKLRNLKGKITINY